MAEIDLLVEGYAIKLGGNKMRASSSCVLIGDNDRKIIVDPGIDRPALTAALKQRDILPDEIDIVFMTHQHWDHVALTGMFDAEVYDGTMVYRGSTYWPHQQKYLPGTSIEMIYTPGHSDDHYALAVPTDQGIYVIAGDLFIWFNDVVQKTDHESLLNREIGHPPNEVLVESRKCVLNIADFIIPGHGKIFQIE